MNQLSNCLPNQEKLSKVIEELQTLRLKAQKGKTLSDWESRKLKHLKHQLENILDAELVFPEDRILVKRPKELAHLFRMIQLLPGFELNPDKIQCLVFQILKREFRFTINQESVQHYFYETVEWMDEFMELIKAK